MSISTYTLDNEWKVVHKTGTEGPHYDPYSYDQYTLFVKGEHVLTIHLGLGDWIKDKDDNKIANNYTECEEAFKDKTGMTLIEFLEKIEEASHITVCKYCGSENVAWVDGFPGESLLQCQECYKILDSHVNLSEIE